MKGTLQNNQGILKKLFLILHLYKMEKGKDIRQMLLKYIHANGEENSYMSCPFGKLIKREV